MAFVLSKIFWVFFSPGNLLALLLIAGAFLAASHHTGRQNFGRRLCFDIAFAFFFIAVFPVGGWALTPLENLYPPVRPAHVDGIIVLGGGENAYLTEKRGQPVMDESARRYIEFAALARQYPQAKLVYTGGSGLLMPAPQYQEANVAKEALASIGVPMDRMVFEARSRNTYENAVDSAALVHPTPQQNWLLVTSAWHMPRAMATFQKAGWNVYPAPTDYRTSGEISLKPEFDLSKHLLKLTLAVHEYCGLVAYYLLGHTNSLWPK